MAHSCNLGGWGRRILNLRMLRAAEMWSNRCQCDRKTFCLYVGVYTCVHTEGWKLMLGISLNAFLFSWDRVCQTNQEPTNIASLRSHRVVEIYCLCCQRLKLQVGYHAHQLFLRFLGIQALVLTLLWKRFKNAPFTSPWRCFVNPRSSELS